MCFMFCTCAPNDLYQKIIFVFDVFEELMGFPKKKKIHIVFTNEHNFNWVVQADRADISQ